MKTWRVIQLFQVQDAIRALGSLATGPYGAVRDLLSGRGLVPPWAGVERFTAMVKSVAAGHFVPQEDCR
jgi:hypothetical protein